MDAHFEPTDDEQSQHLDAREDSLDFDLEDDDDDDGDYGWISFGTLMGQSLSANVKQFLADYYGERMHTLDSDTYLAIEEIISDRFFYEADGIPDLFYRNRKVSHEAFDTALDDYVYTGKEFDWPVRTNEWFEKDYSDDDDVEFTWDLKEPDDITEEEKLAKKAYEFADSFLNDHAKFADFTKQGYYRLVPDVQRFIERRASFDLEMLTDAGWKAVDDCVYWMVTEMLNYLFGTIEADLTRQQEASN